MLVLQGERVRGERDTEKDEADGGKSDEKTGHSEVTRTNRRAGDH